MKLFLSLFIAFSLSNTQFYAQDSISVLFIGNSYVYTNDLPSVFSSLATSLGKTVTVGSKVNGGYTFQNHVNDPATFVAMHQQLWDVVVLQGQSQEPSFPTSQVNANTVPPAMQLADSVYAANQCGNVQYFMTWGRENGDPQWDSINTFEKMNDRLYRAYMRIADSADAMISPVGAVWKYVRDNHPSIGLYVGDGSHPNSNGTYLAGCTFFTSLFQASPVGSFYYGGVDPQTASILQQAAATVILDSLNHFKLHPVDAPTQASFVANQIGATVNLMNTSQRATNYNWEFGNGQLSSDENPIHTYNSNGLYTISFIASSNCNSDTVTKPIEVFTAAVDEFLEGMEWKEFPTYFEIVNSEPILYEIFTTNGQKIQSEQILTIGNHQISKKSTTGFIVFKNSHENQIFIPYIHY